MAGRRNTVSHARTRVVQMKRPLPHHFIIITYIATPLINLLMVALSMRISLGAAASRVLAGYGPLVAVWLVTAPIAGACLYLLNRISWYVFLVHAVIILAGSVVTLGLRLLGDASAIPQLSRAVFILGNVMRIAFVGYVLQKDFRAPYFQILQRSFRGARRMPVRMPIVLDGEAFVTGDLSSGGCFVGGAVPLRAVGDRLVVRLDCGALTLRCIGQVMRSTAGGLGVRFVGLTSRERRALRLLLARRLVRRGVGRGASPTASSRPGSPGTGS
jgi:hypothetical protein